MSYLNGRDYLYLIWHDVNTKKQYIIGTLSKNGKYEFEYNNDIDEALENGFSLLLTFPDKHKKYISEKLFPAFATRLPDKRRVDIEKILDKYDLKEYDEYNLLKRSGAKLPIDNLEFIDPIFEEEENIERKFYVAGSRHWMECSKNNHCNDEIDVKIGDKIELVHETDNPKDANAVVMICKEKKIGYVPRYYAESIKSILEDKVEYSCNIIEINGNNSCRDCIKVDFKVKRK